jgi:cytochrome c553
MPEIRRVTVMRPDVRACGLCHYPNGKRRQENAGISGCAGLRTSSKTMNDFKNGLRKSAEPRKANTNLMVAYAKG